MDPWTGFMLGFDPTRPPPPPGVLMALPPPPVGPYYATPPPAAVAHFRIPPPILPVVVPEPLVVPDLTVAKRPLQTESAGPASFFPKKLVISPPTNVNISPIQDVDRKDENVEVVLDLSVAKRPLQTESAAGSASFFPKKLVISPPTNVNISPIQDVDEKDQNVEVVLDLKVAKRSLETESAGTSSFFPKKLMTSRPTRIKDAQEEDQNVEVKDMLEIGKKLEIEDIQGTGQYVENKDMQAVVDVETDQEVEVIDDQEKADKVKSTMKVTNKKEDKIDKLHREIEEMLNPKFEEEEQPSTSTGKGKTKARPSRAKSQVKGASVRRSGRGQCKKKLEQNPLTDEEDVDDPAPLPKTKGKLSLKKDPAPALPIFSSVVEVSSDSEDEVLPDIPQLSNLHEENKQNEYRELEVLECCLCNKPLYEFSEVGIQEGCEFHYSACVGCTVEWCQRRNSCYMCRRPVTNVRAESRWTREFWPRS